MRRLMRSSDPAVFKIEKAPVPEESSTGHRISNQGDGHAN